MTTGPALITATATSVFISGIVIAIMLKPVRSVTITRCPSPEVGTFWARFTALMLLMVPLILVLSFALPALELASLVRGTLTATLSGHVVVLATVALAFGAVGGAVPRGQPRASRNAYEFWGDPKSDD